MELYIEKAFIDDLYVEIDPNNLNQAKKVLLNIFENYGNVDAFMDVNYDTPKELDDLKKSNPFIAYLFNSKGPVTIQNIKEHFFNHSKCEQTLIFMLHEEDWFKDAEKKGALCFSLETYSKKITDILEWVESLDLDIDEFSGWDAFKFINQIPFNRLTICDNFVLVDKTKQRMDRNILPFLKILLHSKEEQELPVKIFTKELNSPRPGTTEQIRETIKLKHGAIKSFFAKHNTKFKLVNTAFEGHKDIHAREVLNNFVIIRSGEGFNLIPPPESSNETIGAGCIFNKNDYKRINKRMKFYNDYENYLNQLEVLGFKCYP